VESLNIFTYFCFSSILVI